MVKIIQSLGITFLWVCTIGTPSVYSDPFLVSEGDFNNIFLNKCCPTGSFYSIEDDRCLQDLRRGNIIYWSQDYLNVSINVVQNLGNTSGPNNFQYRLKPYNPGVSCFKGYFIHDADLWKNDGKIFTSDGHLIIDEQYYSTPEFCLISANSEKLSIRVCNPVCSGSTPCIKKCCPLNQLWDANRGCVPGQGKIWKPQVLEQNSLGKEQTTIFPHYRVSHPRLWICFDQKFRVNAVGTIYGRLNRFETIELDTQYVCIDGNASAETDPEGHLPSVLFDCSPHTDTGRRNIQPVIYGGIIILSCVCLLLTILVRVLLWDSQPNRRWSFILTSYSVSLLTLYISLVIRFFWSWSGEHGSDRLCYFVGLAWHFSFLATFSWLTVIGFDHWWTFRSMLPSSTWKGSNCFKTYSKYAAFPVLFSSSIITLALILDFLYGNKYNNSVIVPNYGQNCGLNGYYAALAYAYGPAGLLLLLNLIFLSITIFNLYQAQKSAKLATESMSKKSNQRNSMMIFGKLLVIMGVPWVFEIISWFSEHDRSGNTWDWVLFDVINGLQGVAIFWIFVCKSDVIELLDGKFAWFRSSHHILTVDRFSLKKVRVDRTKVTGLLTLMTRLSPTTSLECSRQTTTTTNTDTKS
ncbi:unnamed protein product [Allacma fusca]|uniref:G-protein coupled receptors family 2 profile 2 domain-containing protein n=1 Tax=Allacma fusca TaxID=39272 RepID=A0A8J2JYK3_9HEXA|nr:unnamed protein product [Allacma fusca]